MKHLCISAPKKIYFLSFLFYILIFFNASAQYCVTNLGGAACSFNDKIVSVQISGTSLQNINNTCTSSGSNTLTVFPASGNTTASLMPGTVYSLSVTSTASSIISVWIDYNHNFIYDISEWSQVTLSSTANVASTVQLTIPTTALAGQTGMRIRSRSYGTVNHAGFACTNFYSGETEDYTITISALPSCSGQPASGNCSVLPSQTCSGNTFNLNLTGNTLASGLLYEWQVSADSTNWTTISSDTVSALSWTQNSSNYYRCIVSCSGNGDTTEAFFVRNVCYCASGPSSVWGEDIGNVTFAGINNGVASPVISNPNSTSTYSDFTSLPAPTLTSGQVYPISISVISSSATSLGDFVTIHFDFNQDGAFNNSDELYLYKYNAANKITIPFNASGGITRMRVIVVAGGSATQSPCGMYTAGETEDYLVNIIPLPPCSGTPVAGTAAAQDSTICIPTAMNLTLVGNAMVSGQNYQWQESTDSITWTNVVPASNHLQTITTDMLNTTLYFRCQITCSGITVNSGAVLVTHVPLSQCYCNSGEQVPTQNGINTDIGYFSVGSFINQESDTSAYNNLLAIQSYSDFTALPPLVLNRAHSYTAKLIKISNQANTAPGNGIFGAIDYNQNGGFEASETISFAPTLGHLNAYTSNFTVPVGSKIGNTRLRVMLQFATGPYNWCGPYSIGETEDYTVYIDYPLASENLIEENLIAVFPNPASESLTITCAAANLEKTQVRMFDLRGQLVYEDSFCGDYNRTLDVSEFAKGVYVLQMMSDSKVITRKVVVE